MFGNFVDLRNYRCTVHNLPQFKDLKNLSDELPLPKNSKRLYDLSTAIGSALNFVPQVMKFPKIPINEADGELSARLERQPELKYIWISVLF